jgi:integral membrane protein
MAVTPELPMARTRRPQAQGYAWLGHIGDEPLERGVHVRGALIRYRIMAWIVGVGLILVFIGIPFQAAGHPGFENVIGPIHGTLYIIYLIAGADLARRAHWTLGRIVMVVVAGFVPFLAFIVERKVTHQLEQSGALDVSAS